MPDLSTSVAAGQAGHAALHNEERVEINSARSRLATAETSLAGKAATIHTHTASQISDSTVVGRNVITAIDAPAVRTAIGAGTSSLVIGTTSGTAADAAALATSLSGKAATVHTHASADISDSTTIGRSVITSVDAAAVRTAIGAGTSNLVIGTGAGTAADAAALTTSLALKAPLASPAFTGTPTGITKTHVGLANVDNTADSAKPISTLQQAALDLKAPLASPALTGTPTAPTATAGTNTTAIATTAFVTAGLALKINTSAIPADLGSSAPSTSIVTIGQFATAFKRWPFPITYNTTSNTWPARSSVVPSWYTGPAQYEALTTVGVSQPVDLVTGDVVVDLYAS